MARNRHEERKSGWKWALLAFAIVLMITFSYSVVRYNIFKGVPADQIPLFIFNKAISLTAVVLIGLSFFIGPMARLWTKKFAPFLYMRKYLGVLGFAVAAMHSVISLLLFSPSYYPKFFAETGKLTMTGELSMLFGVLAIFIFSGVAVTSMPSVEKQLHPKQWKFVQRLGYLAFIFTLLHVWAMGWEGWINPSGWPAGLLPISLLAAMVIIAVLIARSLAIIFPKK